MNYTEASEKNEHWKAVIDHAQKHQCQWAKDPTNDQGNWGIHLNDEPPHNRLLGPVFNRGPVTGIVETNGQIQCQWGDPDRADMTFSVTKTYLALTAGIAFDQGVLPDLDEPVATRLGNLGFDDEHNRQITWRQLLQFTSEWQGECFGVPDRIDHYRQVAFQSEQSTPQRKGQQRPLNQPGTHWEYNDIRINQFSLALMHLLKRPLPEVFNEFIMQPIGASNTWQWHGYDNSWVEIEGTRMQSVPGGGHWGGGMQISASDQLKVARLMLDRGAHNGKQVISQAWIDQMLTPCNIAPFYGYFTWLNQGHQPVRTASRQSYFGLGIGGQVIWHDPTRNLAAVFRWIDTAQLEPLVELVNKALDAEQQNDGT